MITTEFGTYWPTKGHKMLLETRPAGVTGLPRWQAASRWILSLWHRNLQGKSSPKMGKTYFWTDE